MGTHTPGPWRVGDTTITEDARPYIFADGCIVAKAYRVTVNGELPGEANARLIAAAPDMLLALKVALTWSDKDWIGHEIVTAAIAKAEA